jgi:hypothetical protein
LLPKSMGISVEGFLEGPLLPRALPCMMWIFNYAGIFPAWSLPYLVPIDAYLCGTQQHLNIDPRHWLPRKLPLGDAWKRSEGVAWRVFRDCLK